MKLIASMQPTGPPGQMGLPLERTLSRIGKVNWVRSYAWRAVRDAGIDLIFSTDWPVSPVSPVLSLHPAMMKPWTDDLPDNRQTLIEVLEAYTVRGAYADFAESWKSMLKPGYVADHDRKTATPLPKLVAGDRLELHVRDAGGKERMLPIPPSAASAVEALLATCCAESALPCWPRTRN